MLPRNKTKIEILQEKLDNETNEYKKEQLASKIALLKKKTFHNSALEGTYTKVKVANK